MTSLHRVIVSYSGGNVVGTAVNVLHFSASDNAAPPLAAIRAAFNAAAGIFTNSTTIDFPSSGDTIDDTTGHLIGVWSVTPQPASVVGSQPGASAAGVGACIGWTTGGIVNGSKGPRKLRGRTFLVPLSSGAYDVNGHLTSFAITTAQTLADSIMGAGPLAVWHRPTTKGGSDGNSYGVGAARVRNKVAYLSSRRD